MSKNPQPNRPNTVGEMCECGTGLATRAVVFGRTTDYYCEACYIEHCGLFGEQYVPLGEDEPLVLDSWEDVRVLAEYVRRNPAVQRPIVAKALEDEPRTRPNRMSEDKRVEQMLMLLEMEPGLSVDDLYKRMGYSAPKMVHGMLTKLVRDGVVLRELNPEDGRLYQYYRNNENMADRVGRVA